MNLLRRVLEEALPERPRQRETQKERFMREHGLDEAGYSYWLAYGQFPRPRRAMVVMPDGPSPAVPGRKGLSREAVELFDLAQRAGGPFPLWRLRARARVEELRQLVDELVHFGLAEHVVMSLPAGVRERGWDAGPSERQRAAVRVLPEFEQAIVSQAGCWSRWEG